MKGPAELWKRRAMLWKRWIVRWMGTVEDLKGPGGGVLSQHALQKDAKGISFRVFRAGRG